MKWSLDGYRQLVGLCNTFEQIHKASIDFQYPFDLAREDIRLTLAEVLVVSSDSLAVVDERPLGVEVSRRPVGKSPVIEMEEMAIVRCTERRTAVQERSAQKFVLQFARQLAGSLALNLKFLVGVVVKSRVLGDFVVGNADSRCDEVSLRLAGVFACGKKIK